MFQGTSLLSLDAKGRITIPVRHRDALALQCKGQVTLTLHPDGCLLLLPRPVWETLKEKIKGLPLTATKWRRLFMGNAQDVDMDSNGRVLISPDLRQTARLVSDVKLVGMGSHFEIWDAAQHAENETETMAEGMPEILGELIF
ncbi:MAG: division/cell wall cluster transcriptional repressor MraZ [Burkholderiaceae bacterium]|nr:division/cell wall cluster transcriptional repressor MraZ [Burkholderiaceae bacterium]